MLPNSPEEIELIAAVAIMNEIMPTPETIGDRVQAAVDRLTEAHNAMEEDDA